jgi:microcystin-dependent protein
MSDPFLGQITLFAFNYAPNGWAQCLGQLLPISQNTALFSILGTNYGGDGKSTFALPNLQGSAAIASGQGPALSWYPVGDAGGSSTVTLVASEMAQHSHAFIASSDQASAQGPAGNLLAQAVRPAGAPVPASAGELEAPAPQQVQANFYSQTIANAHSALAPNAIGPAGGGQPHNNMQPYLALNFCIAMMGIYPPRD